MSLHEHWVYEQADPAMMLFTAALRAWQLPILPGQRILELGCNESDFLTRLHRTMGSLELHGVDARPWDGPQGHAPDGWTFTQGCAWDQSLFEPASFDWILMLGALEHFGLGYYGDPIDHYSQGLDPDAHSGDERTIDACAHWLRPGGGLYFDVPCNPQASINPHFRTYEAGRPLITLPIEERESQFSDRGRGGFPLHEIARGWSLPEPSAGCWVPQPTVHLHPYHFVAVWARKT